MTLFTYSPTLFAVDTTLVEKNVPTCHIQFALWLMEYCVGLSARRKRRDPGVWVNVEGYAIVIKDSHKEGTKGRKICGCVLELVFQLKKPLRFLIPLKTRQKNVTNGQLSLIKEESCLEAPKETKKTKRSGTLSLHLKTMWWMAQLAMKLDEIHFHYMLQLGLAVST